MVIREAIYLDRTDFSPWLVIFGLSMLVLSTAGRLWAIQTLGPYHSIHIEIRKNHKLIQAGPYSYVRNPYYLSVILEVSGMTLMANAFIAAFVALLVYLPVLVLRIVLEENALQEKFNGAFVDYARRVPRLIPRLL